MRAGKSRLKFLTNSKHTEKSNFGRVKYLTENSHISTTQNRRSINTSVTLAVKINTNELHSHGNKNM